MRDSSPGIGFRRPRWYSQAIGGSENSDRSLLAPLVCVAVVPLPLSYGLLGGLRGPWTAYVFALVICLAILGRLREPRGYVFWLTLAALGTISGVTGVYYSSAPLQHVQAAALLILMWILLPPLVAAAISDSSARRGATVSFLAAQTMSSAVAVVQAATGASILGQGLVQDRASGLGGHPNILALNGGVALLMCISLLRAGRLKVLLMVVLAVNVAAVIVSGSISVLLAIGIAAVIVLVSHRVSLLLLAGILFAILVGGVISASFGFDPSLQTTSRVAQTTGQTSSEGTFSLRLYTAEFAWNAITEEPLLGRGLGDPDGGTYDRKTVTHNLPLRLWMQGGILLGLVGGLLYVRAITDAANAMRKGAFGGAASVQVMVLAFAFTSAALQQLYFWIPIIVCSVCIHGVHPLKQREEFALH